MAKGRKPRVVDLTRRITHEMSNFPGEPRPGFIRFSGLDDVGFRCRQILMPTHFGTHADAYSHFLPALIRRKIIMLGLDLPSVHPKEYKKVHEMLFRGGVAVTEGLINLSRLPRGEVFFVGLPLTLAGLDGSPIRAVAIVGDSRGL